MKIIALFLLIMLLPVKANAEQGGETEYLVAEKFYEENKQELEKNCECDEIQPLAQKALDLYTSAAEREHAKAKFKIGWMYLSHKVLPYNKEKGLKWWLEAANQGYGPALVNMAGITSEGLIVPQDYKKAFNWYEQAAEKGYGMGQYYLALSYHDAKGTKEDFIKSYAWASASIKTLQWQPSVKNEAIELRKKLRDDHLSEFELEEAEQLAKKFNLLYVKPFEKKKATEQKRKNKTRP